MNQPPYMGSGSGVSGPAFAPPGGPGGPPPGALGPPGQRPPGQRPPLGPKKGLSGCTIAVLVVVALFGLMAVLGGVLLYKAAMSPEGKRATKIVGDTASIMYRAQSAPGAAEVRDKASCDQAYVLTSEDVEKLGRDVNDAAAAHVPSLVTCQVGLLRTAPTCEAVAGIYVAAAHPTGNFVVNVTKTGNVKASCSEVFGKNGVRLKE